jgi:hypothetical protein
MCRSSMCRKLQATPKGGVVLGLVDESFHLAVLCQEFLLAV